MMNMNRIFIVSIILCLGILLYLPDSAHASPTMTPPGVSGWDFNTRATAIVLPAGTVSTPYNYFPAITATGCANNGSNTYNWNVPGAGDGLPTGLSWSETGTDDTWFNIFGVPTAAGTYEFRVRVRGYNAGCTPFNRRSRGWYSITIADPSTVNITTTSLPDGLQGTPYNEIGRASCRERV